MSYEKQFQKGQFLTDKQREYLSGEHEPPTDNAEYQMRSKIRARVKGALTDFFQVNKMSNGDAKKIFEGAGNISTKDTLITRTEGGSDVLPGFPGELTAIIALVCRGYQENGIDPQDFVATYVASGVQKGVADSRDINPNRVLVDIDTTIKTHDDVTELAKRLEREGPAALSNDEGILLYNNDKIDSSELTDILDSSDE